MRELTEKLLALILILLLGALAQRRLPESFYQSANDLVIQVTLPAMILSSMDKAFSPETLETSLRLLVIAVCAFAAVIAGLEVWRRFSKRPAKELGLYQYLVLVGNTAFMGYPVIQAIYGSDGVFYASVFNLVHNVVTFSYGVALFQRDTPIRWRKLLDNACFWSTLAGILLFLSPFRFPAPLRQALDWVGTITIPLCLLSVGARMAGQSWGSLFRPGAVVCLSLIRTALSPAAGPGAVDRRLLRCDTDGTRCSLCHAGIPDRRSLRRALWGGRGPGGADGDREQLNFHRHLARAIGSPFDPLRAPRNKTACRTMEHPWSARLFFQGIALPRMASRYCFL